MRNLLPAHARRNFGFINLFVVPNELCNEEESRRRCFFFVKDRDKSAARKE